MTKQNGLERSSATERIRALLDERGVEWTEPNNEARSHTTYWTAGALRCMAVEFTDGVVSISSLSHDLTPEQAIEATLGRGTCSLVREYFGQSGNWYRLVCSECHHIIYDGWQEKPRYCPFCGRRVVDA